MSLIYQTDDTPLAVTLVTCGIPFDDESVVNYYTREILLKLGYQGSGLSMDEAVTDAWRRGRPGKLVYCFRNVPGIEIVLKAYGRHRAAIQKAAQLTGPNTSASLPPIDVPLDLAAQICCQFASNRKALLDGWKAFTPWIHLPGEVETVREGDKTYRVGSLKLYRLGASAETKAKIGL